MITESCSLCGHVQPRGQMRPNPECGGRRWLCADAQECARRFLRLGTYGWMLPR